MVLFAESVASLLYNKLSGRPWPSQFSIHVGRWSLLTLYTQMRSGGHVLHSAIFNSLSIYLYIGLSLICFLFCLLFYSAILENFPYYSPQYANYSPIILISNPHYIMKIVTYTKQCYDYHDVILRHCMI